LGAGLREGEAEGEQEGEGEGGLEIGEEGGGCYELCSLGASCVYRRGECATWMDGLQGGLSQGRRERCWVKDCLVWQPIKQVVACGTLWVLADAAGATDNGITSCLLGFSHLLSIMTPLLSLVATMSCAVLMRCPVLCLHVHCSCIFEILLTPPLSLVAALPCAVVVCCPVLPRTALPCAALPRACMSTRSTCRGLSQFVSPAHPRAPRTRTSSTPTWQYAAGRGAGAAGGVHSWPRVEAGARRGHWSLWRRAACSDRQRS
jgi:hypothetical protein